MLLGRLVEEQGALCYVDEGSDTVITLLNPRERQEVTRFNPLVRQSLKSFTERTSHMLVIGDRVFYGSEADLHWLSTQLR